MIRAILIIICLASTPAHAEHIEVEIRATVDQTIMCDFDAALCLGNNGWTDENTDHDVVTYVQNERGFWEIIEGE